MLKDLEGHEIKIAGGCNGHILVLGQSGTGKSNFCVHNILSEQKKNILVIDYSSSYTKKELQRHGVRDFSNIRIVKPYADDDIWTLNFKTDEKFISAIVHVIVKQIKARSYKQRKTLVDICTCFYKKYGYISIEELVEYIETILLEGTDDFSYEEEVLDILMCKLIEYKDINIRFINTVYKGYADKRIHILDLSEYSFAVKKTISNMFLELIWQETIQVEDGFYSTLLLDEVQNLEVARGSILECIIKEGRKFGLSTILSTQCISSFSREEQDILKQAGTQINFKPTPREITSIAKEIDYSNYRPWITILNSLKRGMAVIRGSYIVNGNGKSDVPIVCRIEN